MQLATRAYALTIFLGFACAACASNDGSDGSDDGELAPDPGTAPTTTAEPGFTAPPPVTDPSTPPGDYALPPDFTAANMGGYKLGAPIVNGTAAPTDGASDPTGCGSEILGIVRDFRGSDIEGGHPDFESFKGRQASEGIVEALLGADEKPVYAPDGAYEGQHGQQTTSREAFDQWYRNTEGVNQAFFVHLYFQPNGDVYTFDSSSFFPLDSQGWGNEGRNHNFHFTTEIHTTFHYVGGETFSFTGDDDLWVFINGHLAIDLGGLHPPRSLTIQLDTLAPTMGLAPGNDYALDLFHAERHTGASNFRVDTNLQFTNCGRVVPEQIF